MKTVVTIDWRKGGEAFIWLITFLAAAPYALGDVAEWLPPKWKASIFKVGIACGVLLKLWQMFTPPPAVVQLQTTATPVVGNVALPITANKTNEP